MSVFDDRSATVRRPGGRLVAPATSFTSAFTSALQGVPTTVAHTSGGGRVSLPVAVWTGPADRTDHLLLDLCDGATLDVGCGPGRLTAELTNRGHRALGLDVVAEAVRLTRVRGAAAHLGDVFDPVPDEGGWDTVLLADGNVGIGGHPGRLLRRVAQVLRPGGQAVVEVGPPGSGSHSGWTSLEGPYGRSRPFRWARLAAGDVPEVACAAGLHLVDLHELSPSDTERTGRYAVRLRTTHGIARA